MNAQQSKYPVSLLLNSVYFFLHYVLIVKEGEIFRLLVIKNGEKLVDKKYRTIKGARIAFHRSYKKQGYKDNIETEWTYFYNPDITWLEELLNCPGRPFMLKFKLSKKTKKASHPYILDSLSDNVSDGQKPFYKKVSGLPKIFYNV